MGIKITKKLTQGDDGAVADDKSTQTKLADCVVTMAGSGLKSVHKRKGLDSAITLP